MRESAEHSWILLPLFTTKSILAVGFLLVILFFFAFKCWNLSESDIKMYINVSINIFEMYYVLYSAGIFELGQNKITVFVRVLPFARVALFVIN